MSISRGCKDAKIGGDVETRWTKNWHLTGKGFSLKLHALSNTKGTKNLRLIRQSSKTDNLMHLPNNFVTVD